MPLRRHHVKSRHGCVQCKARRTKCDEVRPTCTKCQQRGSVCSFGQDPNTLIFIDGPSARKASASKSATTGSGSAIASETASAYSSHASSSPVGDNLLQAPNFNTLSLSAASPSASSVSTRSSRDRLGSGTGFLFDHQSPPFAGIQSPAASLTTFTPSEVDNLRLMSFWYTTACRLVLLSHDESENFEQRDLCALPEELLHNALVNSREQPPSITGRPHPLRDWLGPSSNVPGMLRPFDQEKAIRLAEHHHALSLQFIGPALKDAATATNLTPLFLSACMISTFAFTRACVGPPNPDIIGEIAHALTLLRGTGTIIRAGVQHMTAPTGRQDGHMEFSPIAAFIYPHPARPHGPLPPAAEAFMAGLLAVHATRFPTFAAADHPNPTLPTFSPEANGPDDGSSEAANARAYAGALRHLRHALLLAGDDHKSDLVAVPFGVSMPSTVLEGLRQRDLLALGLVSGYAVVLHELRNHVWIQDWGSRVIYGTSEALREIRGNEGIELIAWPRAVINGEADGMAGWGALQALRA